MSDVLTFDERLNADFALAQREGDLYFSRAGSVWHTFRRVANFLSAKGLPYVAIDDLAMFHHGFRQFAGKVTVLVTKQGFDAVELHAGLVRNSPLSHRFFDLETGVPVLFEIEGRHPRGGTVCNVRLPNPADVVEEDDGLNFINLPGLITSKLAGTKSDSRDWADVQETVKVLCLTQDLADALHPDVRNAFRGICDCIDSASGPFLLVWESDGQLPPCSSIDDLIAADDMRAPRLRAMKAAGVETYPKRPSYQGAPVLWTASRVVARKFGLHPESEHWFPDDPANSR